MSRYLKRNWATSRPNHALWAWPALALALVLLMQLWPATLSVAAQEPLQISVTHQQASATFSESLDFEIAFDSNTPIVEAILFYGQEGERLVRRVYPRLAPGDTQINYQEALEPGQYAPGVRLRYWWRLMDASGGSIDTPIAYLAHDDARFDWQIMPTGQLSVHWYGDRQDRAQAEAILARGQQVLSLLKQEMGVVSGETINIYIYNTQRDMSPALSMRSDAYDELILTLGVAIGQDTLLLLGSHRDVELTVAHELSHIVTHMATDNPYTGLPRWLDEGLAMVASGELPSDNEQALKEGIRQDALLTIRSMSSYSGRAELVDLYYGEVYSVVDFMLKEYGRDRMQELLHALAQGRTQQDALQAVYGVTLEELDALWRTHLGLEPRVLPESHGVPYPLSLATRGAWR